MQLKTAFVHGFIHIDLCQKRYHLAVNGDLDIGKIMGLVQFGPDSQSNALNI